MYHKQVALCLHILYTASLLNASLKIPLVDSSEFSRNTYCSQITINVFFLPTAFLLLLLPDLELSTDLPELYSITVMLHYSLSKKLKAAVTVGGHSSLLQLPKSAEREVRQALWSRAARQAGAQKEAGHHGFVPQL